MCVGGGRTFKCSNELVNIFFDKFLRSGHSAPLCHHRPQYTMRIEISSESNGAELSMLLKFFQPIFLTIGLMNKVHSNFRVRNVDN